ncbi:hypothetical protein [Pseudodesulfovibrio sp. zrk46]|uniref:hypothetical protein n=1 Tax=Pseudodesulfovibrio sp. zrk46 TaxID=2725288 RepID=UPI0014493A4B|nr:hypothetical protein [Pseudodesulfovibrio sp. zrk46]QJB56270.1 hypothetical protein HFN16_07520 [Pseudodesulfovibrio sp. zrk46]
MLQLNNFIALLWWAGYTILGVWAQRFVPGVDFLAPGIVLSMQEEAGHRTIWLALIWILLQEGIGNLPFGYGLAWYGSLALFYVMGRWLFEARSILFVCLLGLGLGVLHPVLLYGLSSLADLTIPLKPAVMEGVAQAALFPVIWLLADKAFPRRMRQDVRPL